MSDLLTCPFCGGEAELIGSKLDELWVWVWCPNCKACTDAHTVKQSAIEAWNMRYDPRLDAIPATEENMKRYGWVRERTCKVEGSYTDNWEYQTWGFELSCGHDVPMLFNAPPNYCPVCGAKVVIE